MNNILGTGNHIKGTSIAANFKTNIPLVCVYCVLKVGGVILYQSYLRLSISDFLSSYKRLAKSVCI